ncbi:MAG TPA: hypothetical protein ENI05_09550 [Porticoccus sp.]|nr:hypothetical protein [Porticoccus sp.]
MKHPSWNDFIYRVGGVTVLFLIVIFSFNKYAPSYVGIAIFVTSILVIFIAGLVVVKSKKQRKKKGASRHVLKNS